MAELLVAIRCGHPDPAQARNLQNPDQVIDHQRTHKGVAPVIKKLADDLLMASQSRLRLYCGKTYAGSGPCPAWHMVLRLRLDCQGRGNWGIHREYTRLDPMTSVITDLAGQIQQMAYHHLGVDSKRLGYLARRKWDAMRVLLVQDRRGLVEQPSEWPAIA